LEWNNVLKNKIGYQMECSLHSNIAIQILNLLEIELAKEGVGAQTGLKTMFDYLERVIQNLILFV